MENVSWSYAMFCINPGSKLGDHDASKLMTLDLFIIIFLLSRRAYLMTMEMK
jgi:hypothetical protein